MNSILFLFSSIYDQSAASSSAKEASSLSESRAEEQEDLPYCRSCSETAEIFQVTGNYCLLAPRSAWPQEVSLQSPAVSDARENLNGVSLLGSESVCVPSFFILRLPRLLPLLLLPRLPRLAVAAFALFLQTPGTSCGLSSSSRA
jgi:hypothetical protein